MKTLRKINNRIESRKNNKENNYRYNGVILERRTKARETKGSPDIRFSDKYVI